MAVMPILTIPDERLFKEASKVTDFGPETQKIVQDLLDTLRNAKNPEGAGLAAPQIGVLKRIIIVRDFFYGPKSANKPMVQDIVLINPKIVGPSRETLVDWEACLSIPDTYGKVERFKKIKVKAQNEQGEEIRLTASGYLSAVIQHEIDHLDGILFTTKVIGNTITEKELDALYA